ncbi:Methionyl-tRNA formyltransferase [Operophtera brumata]|uniref:Methionyl-tRNA formyltransferase n=1 Tax=Operophtera brumata TaxID=104452 RepID=A0A0L7KSR3_OPEBR|nr:Methionyl-tRNA formyltransferase [Operophtera brumata]
MLFIVSNLSRAIKIIYKEKCRYLRYYSTKKSYKLLFFGSDSIAFSSFKKVNEFRKTGNVIDRLDLVITNNAKNKSEIEKYAQAENITTKLWPLQGLQAAEYDMGLIVAFGHLIKDDLLDKFPL